MDRPVRLAEPEAEFAAERGQNFDGDVRLLRLQGEKIVGAERKYGQSHRRR